MLPRILFMAAALWFGTMAGFFWSFSAVVMPGLDLSDPETALIAMQDINRAVRNPVFGIGFFGAAVMALSVVVVSIANRRSLNAVPLLAAAIYLVGALAVTAVGNVPLNDALAAVAASEAAAVMPAYIRDWSVLNHVRTLAALTATALMIWSLSTSREPEAPLG